MQRYLLPLFLLITGFAVGFFTPHQSNPVGAPAIANSSYPVRQSGYHYINPLLECELGVNIEQNLELKTLKNQLVTQIEELKQDPRLTHVAVYFRDLNNGPSFGINDDSKFSPASLLKTPLLLAYLKLAEENPAILAQHLRYDQVDNPPESPSPNLAPLRLNSDYTVQELLERTIIHSDNNAFNLLALHIPYSQITQVHVDLGLAIPDESTPEDFITVKQYAGIFRVLFNASYLNRTMSESALGILAQAKYRDGLVAGVDKQVEVAHKYGVRHGTDNVDQLHDCGIVYFPGHPYLLCIMTKGTDFPVLTHTLANLSSTIYSAIQNKYPNP